MKSRLFVVAADLVVAIMFGSCSNITAENENDVSEKGTARAVPNWSLWDSMSSFNTGVWNKADWTNGGMFNCGWKPDHAYFSGGQLVLKLDNVSSHGRPYTSAEYRT